MSARSPSSITSDLVHCETKEDLSRLISLLHSGLESECESCITKSKIDSTVVILLETDTILCSLTAKFDETIVQFTWKRLISFVKSYHALLSSELIVLVTEALTCRAYQFIDALRSAHALMKPRNHSSDDQCPDYTSLTLCVQPLIFFSQRISALLAYFPSRLPDTSYQRSIEVIFFLRGFLSTLELHPSHQSHDTLSFNISDSISRSEEYFWKALHPPLTASINDLDGGMSSTMNRQKRFRNGGDVNKSSISERSSYGHLMPLEKFHLCVRSISSTCCSVTKEKVHDLKQGEGFLGCMISVGVCLLASYELEKLSDHIKSTSSTTSSDTAEHGGLLNLPHTHTESYLQPDPSISILKIFLFSADKVLVLYNSVCSDNHFTGALKRFKEAVLNYLESSYTSVHNVPGRTAAISDALLVSLGNYFLFLSPPCNTFITCQIMLLIRYSCHLNITSD